MSWEANVRTVTPYVAGEQPKGQGVIKLNTNESPYPPAPGVQRVLREYDAGILRKYPDAQTEPLLSELAAYYGVEKEQVFVGVGSDDVLAMAFLTFFNHPTLPVLFPDITYSFYDVWAELLRIPYETQALDERFCIKEKDYYKPNGGVIIPNPNAPTGELAPVSLFENIVRANPDVVCIVDEAYIDFGGESCLKLIDRYENLLVVRTFSKSRALAGMRIGYAFGSKKLIRYLNDAKYSFNSYTMNSVTLAAGVEALRDDAYFKEITGRVVATRERSKRRLVELGFTFPDSKSNFIFATHEKYSAKELFEALRAHNIYVRYWDKPRIGNYLRISIGTDAEMDELFAFLKEMKQNGEKKL
ncbi:MAG: histidinol-phosphate transaminase [Clostridium sp.]|nr:histidinol-phosphate transaminase [Clostridium sp.]